MTSATYRSRSRVTESVGVDDCGAFDGALVGLAPGLGEGGGDSLLRPLAHATDTITLASTHRRRMVSPGTKSVADTRNS